MTAAKSLLSPRPGDDDFMVQILTKKFGKFVVSLHHVKTELFFRSRADERPRAICYRDFVYHFYNR